MARSWIHFAGVGACAGLVSLYLVVAPAAGAVVSLQLDALDATITPSNGGVSGMFPAVDVNGYYGTPFAPVYMHNFQTEVWTDCPMPGANQGWLDTDTGLMALNWGIKASFDVFDGGFAHIGTGEIRIGMAEEGGFNPMTGEFYMASINLATGDTGTITVDDDDGDSGDTDERVIVINNNKGGDIIINAFDDFDGTFDPGAIPGPELGITLPIDWGGAILFGDLSGTFHMTPEPATLGLLALGAVAVVRRRR